MVAAPSLLEEPGLIVLGLVWLSVVVVAALCFETVERDPQPPVYTEPGDSPDPVGTRAGPSVSSVYMRASDRAYERLRAEILDWRLEPGTVLAEVEQAARLGVSRTPLREALARLLADGLVESQSARGLVVSSASIENVVELFEVRAALEGQAAALAARRRAPEVFQGLRDELLGAGALLSGRDRGAYYDLVRRLDDAIDEAAGNAYLAGELKALRTHLHRIRRLSSDDAARLEQATAEHLAIVDAILSGDPELARSATLVHLQRSLASIASNSRNPLERTTA